jgi:hypothetical protein
MADSGRTPKREPKNVKRLIEDAQARQARKNPGKPTPPPINAVHTTKPSLWAKFRRRGNR